MSILLSVRGLRKSYGSRVVFDDVSLSVDDGEKVGLIGVNGSGKSTLLKLIHGEYLSKTVGADGAAAGARGAERADTIELALRRGATVGYLAQEPVFTPGITIRSAAAEGHAEIEAAIREYQRVADALANDPSSERLLARQAELGGEIDRLGGWDWEHRVETILTRVGLDGWDHSVDALSGGELKRVALARVLLQQPDLLLLDEPTNHLDVETTDWLEEHLASYPGAVILITHDRYFLDRVVNRMIEVSRAELTPYPGGYTEYLEAKAEREALDAARDEKRARLIEQELAWVRRSPSARTGKQKARIKRLDETVERQVRERAPQRETAQIAFGAPPRLGRTVLELDGISKAYDGRVLLDGLSTSLRAGERIGIVGPNGVGKTTLLRIILGEEEPDAGGVKLGKNTRIAYFDQRREDLDPNDTVMRAVADTDWVEPGGRRVHIRSYLDSFLFPPEVHDQPVRSLSGGERNRVLLARLLLREANLLIMDEPTNDLDLVTLQVLEEALVDFAGCVLIVTHDRFFLDKIATGLLVFEGNGVVHRHEGGYDLYRRLKADRERVEPVRERAPAREPTRPTRRADAPRRLTYQERKELEVMEEMIQRAEEERGRLEAALSDPDLYASAPERIASLSAELRDASERVERLYARWEELESFA